MSSHATPFITDAMQYVSGEPVRRARLAGHAVFVTMAGEIPVEFVPQRAIRASWAAADVLNPPRLTIGVNRELTRRGLRRASYAVEDYLRHALRRSRQGTTAVIGVIEGGASLYADVLVARHGRLLEYMERELPAPDSSGLDSAVATIVNDIRQKWPTAQIVQGGTVRLPGTDLEYIGDRPAGFRYVSSATQSASREFVMPALIAGAGLVFYLGAVGLGWSQYQRARATYEAAALDPQLKALGGLDNAAIDVMQQRRIFMDEPRRQVQLARKTGQVVTGISSIPSVRILSMSLPAPSVGIAPRFGVAATPEGQGAPREPDIKLILSVPIAEGTALDQAQALMKQLAAATGLTLRLQYQGWRDDRDQRVFTMEGFVNEQD